MAFVSSFTHPHVVAYHYNLFEEHKRCIFEQCCIFFDAITRNENFAHYKSIIELVHITCALYCMSSKARRALCEKQGEIKLVIKWK